MNKYWLLILFVCSFTQTFAQLDTANISITNFRLHEGTFNWRGTNTFFDRTNWDSSPYIDGHLKHYNGTFRQNFRLLIPQGYDPDYEPGYPIMIVWHGAVERGNCFKDDCYYGTRTYNPNTEPIPMEESDIDNLLNNDHQLLHGANHPHIPAWNSAGTMKVDDPALPVRAFPGFVLFPQNLNGWNTTDMRDAIRTLRLVMKKYNIDPDRVYAHGLSNGGQGLLNALVEAPWLFSTVAVMSPLTSGNFRNNAAKVAGIPVWFFQGGKDTDPTPGATEQTVAIFRAAGGNARYTLYEDLGHGTWNTAYREPDFFTWFLGNVKSNIHIAYGSPTICGTTGEPAKLSLPAGFFAYQWQRNGVTIEGATSNTYEASTPGVYRARYSRVSATPTEDEWNRWSDEVTVTEATPTAPVLNQIGSVHLRDLNSNNTARLEGPPGFQQYQWYKDGVLTSIPTTTASPSITPGTDNVNMGTYTLVTSGLDNCPSEPSNPKTVFFSDLAPVNIPAPTNFSGTLTAPTTVLLRWNDVSGNERHYEIWRRKSTDASGNGWTFVTLTNEDAILYEDKNLNAGTEYWYKIRAVSATGRSNYAPGNSKTIREENLIITTDADNTPPTAPQNLTAIQHDTDIATRTVSIRLNWGASSDAGGVNEYEIRYGNQSVIIPATQETSYVVSGLPLNTVYDFRVVARDISGNESVPSNQANANTYIDGFFWEHSTAAFTDIRDVPQELWDDPEFEGRSANLTLEPALQEEFLVFRFYGYLYITTPGMYRLRMKSNDGVLVYVDGVERIRRTGLVTNVDCATTNFNPYEPIFLDEGAHAIEVRYFQYSGPKCLYMEWNGPDADPNPDRWRPVPDERIRSYESPPSNNVPPAPVDLVAVANGMTQIDLSWTYNGEQPVEFEVYRSQTETGTFAIVNRTAETTYADTGLLPSTTYYYKVKTVSGTNVSEFSAVASATTEQDTEAPTQPTALTLFSQTLTSASIAWTESEDNTVVEGYEIWVNGTLNDTAPSNFFLITGLEPLQTYSVYVVAFDPDGNKSEPSNTITFDTSTPEIFYSKPTGNLNVLATWGKNPDGTGDAPLDFKTNGSYFVIANRTTSSVGGTWEVNGTVSKILVPEGVTLTTESPVTGRLEVEDGGTVVVANASYPTFVNLGVASNIQYNQSVQQIQRAAYGNLMLMGTGNKTFPSGETTIYGDLVAADGIGIKGAGSNQSTVILYGDLSFTGSPAFIPSDVSVAIELRKNGMQTLDFAGSLSLYRLTAGPDTEIGFGANENTATLLLGSDAGGGLVLNDGSALHLGANTLQLTGGASLNPGGEQGVIHVNDGTIDISSSASVNSNLFTAADENSIYLLRSAFTGSGSLTVQSPVLITEGLKVSAGTFNANGNVTLVSNENKTANLQAIEGNGRVIGDVNVQRFMSEKPRTYRYISSPVEGQTIEDWQEFFAITGPFDGTSTGPGLKTQHSMFMYEAEGWIGYPSSTLPEPYNDNKAPIERGRGYAVFVRNPSAVQMVSRGVPYQGVIVFDVHGPLDGVELSEWNLLGNPYASTIAWSNDAGAWAKNQIGNIIAVRNNFNTSSGQFQYYDAATGLGTGEGGTLDGGRIAPGQAFWVQATGASPTLSISETAKSTGQQELYREGVSSSYSHAKLTLQRDTQTDYALIVFTDFGTDAFDNGIDGLKMSNEGMFNLATRTTDGHTVAINNLSDSYCSRTVAINIANTPAGSYTVGIESPETLSGVGSLRLLDHLTNRSVDLLDESYTFDVTSDPATRAEGRFELTIERPAIDMTVVATTVAGCTEDSQIILTNTQRGATYEILNSDLAKVGEAQISDGADLTFNIPAALLMNGINEYNIRASFKGCEAAMIPGSATIEYYSPPVVTAEDVTVCVGSTALVNAEGKGEISHYAWYDGEGNRIKAFTGNELTTEPVTEVRHYFVNAVSPTGCAGPRFLVTVTPDSLEVPEILVAGDTLRTSVLAGEYTWSRNDEVVASSSSQWYLVPDKPGDYTLTVKNQGCAKTSRAFLVTGATMGERLVSGLYPNPTRSDNINVRVYPSGPDPVRITIVDVTGRLVYDDTFFVDNLSERIRLAPKKELKPGVYVLSAEQKSKIEKIKFIIQE